MINYRHFCGNLSFFFLSMLVQVVFSIAIIDKSCTVHPNMKAIMNKMVKSTTKETGARDMSRLEPPAPALLLPLLLLLQWLPWLPLLLLLPRSPVVVAAVATAAAPAEVGAVAAAAAARFSRRLGLLYSS